MNAIFSLTGLADKITALTLCIQQTGDKAGSSAELRRLVVTENYFFTMHEIAGEDHQYKDIPQLTRIIKKMAPYLKTATGRLLFL